MLSSSPGVFSLSLHLSYSFFFYPPLSLSPPSHLVVSFSLIPLPASTFTHSSSKSSLSSPSHFPHPAFMPPILLDLSFFSIHSFPLFASLDLRLPSVPPVFRLLSPSSLLLYFSILPGSVFIFSSILCLYHLFPLLDSLLHPLSVSPSSCLFPPLLLCPHLCVSGSLFVLSSL